MASPVGDARSVAATSETGGARGLVVTEDMLVLRIDALRRGCASAQPTSSSDVLAGRAQPAGSAFSVPPEMVRRITVAATVAAAMGSISAAPQQVSASAPTGGRLGLRGSDHEPLRSDRSPAAGQRAGRGLFSDLFADLRKDALSSASPNAGHAGSAPASGAADRDAPADASPRGGDDGLELSSASGL